MDAMTLLTTRYSTARLTEPAPSAKEQELLFQAAIRAPDHAKLQPWRFVTIEGEARQSLGKLFADALVVRNPNASEAEIDKCHAQPLRAPLVIVVVVSLSEHPKVPEQEQWLSAGCAAHSLLLACQAMGYGAIWRTGPNAFDKTVFTGLKLASNEAVAGFLYVGTPLNNGAKQPLLASKDFVSAWG